MRTTPYVAAVGVRTAARAVWGIVIPTAISVAAYGRYQVLAVAAAMVAQVALLGAPQTIVRFAGRRMPMQLLGLHAGLLATLGVAVAALVLPTVRTPEGVVVLSTLGLATVASTLLGARAKARFAFRTSLLAETAGAGVLMIAAMAAIISTPARRVFMEPTRALLLEAVALAVTGALLLRARAQTSSEPTPTPPDRRAVFASIYSVGALALLDVVVFRRLEVYFLERSPDGLAGVAVLGLALQIATVALLVPTALLEAWQPRFALAANAGDEELDNEVARYGRAFAWMMAAIVAGGVTVPLVAIPLAFPHYQPWTGYIVALVAIRIACAGAGFFSSVMYATGRHRALYPSAVVAAGVAICGNALLTARLGLRGALVAYGLTQLTLALLTAVAFRRSSSRKSYGVQLSELTPIQETVS